MSLAHETIYYDVADLIVWPMTTDPSNASPTYGAAVDVPGVAEVGLDPNITANDLKGDGRVLASKARIDNFSFSATYGKAALDVLDTIYGGNQEESATEVSQHLYLPQAPPLFAVRFVVDDVDLGLGALMVTAYKVKLTGGTMLGSGSDAFGQPTIEGSATQPNHATDVTGTVFTDYTPTVTIALLQTLAGATVLP